jgi:hypothetical protein
MWVWLGGWGEEKKPWIYVSNGGNKKKKEKKRV